MKTTKFIPKQKLQAATRQISRPMAGDYDDEPNMKLSSAFYVVLVLHLVAVGGIFTFSRIKAQQAAPIDTSYQPAPAASPSDEVMAQQGAPESAPVATAKTTDAPKTETTGGVKDSGEIYTVAKGDNPVAIARKLHVSYAGLLKLNKIDDPKKLQIGQKLRIPVRNKPVHVDN